MTGTVRILYVDDESDFADTAATFLEREDERFAITTKASASAGLTYLADHDVDCVVSDYDMPDRDGIEFFHTARENHLDLPFILFTGKGSEEIAGEAISAGVTDYLQKGTGTDQYTVLANRISNAVEHHQAGQAVEIAERKLSRIAEKTDDVLFMFDDDWSELLFVNSAYEDVWGASIAELRQDPDVFLESVHPEDREMVIQSMERIANGEEDDLHYRIVRPDGERRWVRADSKPVLDDQGNVTRIVGFVRDVTEEKKRQQELERVKERFRTLIEYGSDILTVIDESGVIQYQSPAIETVLGYEPAELVDENAFEYIHSADRDDAVEALAEVIDEPETLTRRIEYRFKHADGSWTWLETVGNNQSNTSIEGYVLTSREITERKERERRLKALNDTSQELMAADTREVVVETGISLASDVLGLDANGICLYDDDRSALVPAAQTEACRELIAERPTDLGDGTIAWRVYKRGEAAAIDDVHDDPELYNPDTDIQSELFLPIDDFGILIAASETPAAFTQQDIVFGEILSGTIARALEQAEQTEQLRARERDLRRQNERLEEFASVVSHDLRSPLQVASGRLDLAKAECESEHLHAAVDALDRMQLLIDDLLALAHDGDVVGELEPIDLAIVTKKCWQTVETAEASLVTDVDQEIHADASRLQQLLANLMRNAIDHGGRDVTISVADLEDGFYVEDDGPGISEPDFGRIFEAGYTTSEEGTGFGLSIVKQVAEAHDWNIRVTAGPSGGTRFEITNVVSNR